MLKERANAIGLSLRGDQLCLNRLQTHIIAGKTQEHGFSGSGLSYGSASNARTDP